MSQVLNEGFIMNKLVPFLKSFDISRDVNIYSVINISSTVFFIGLTPYTNYQYQLSACTVAGCSNSTVLQTATKQQAPQG